MFDLIAAQVRENDFDIAAEFPKQLAASAARRSQNIGIGYHRDALKFGFPFGNGFPEGDPLRANRKSVGGILHIATGENLTVPGLERSSYFESRVGGARIEARL